MLKRPYDFLELYKNSAETEKLLEPYAELLNYAKSNVKRAQRAVLVNLADDEDIRAWLNLYKPPECAALTDRERVCDAENFFIGSPLWRIKAIVARMCGVDPDDVSIAESECIVIITLPTEATYRANVYADYIAHIKPAHVELLINRLRTHAQMGEYTHAQLAAYTHSGREL